MPHLPLMDTTHMSDNEQLAYLCAADTGFEGMSPEQVAACKQGLSTLTPERVEQLRLTPEQVHARQMVLARQHASPAEQAAKA